MFHGSVRAFNEVARQKSIRKASYAAYLPFSEPQLVLEQFLEKREL